MSTHLTDIMTHLTHRDTHITAYAVVLLDEHGDIHEHHEYHSPTQGIDWQAQLAGYVASYADCIRAEPKPTAFTIKSEIHHD